ncbi:MAG TPA: alpha/beta hydrolase, partial [Burkholderiales bacterium]|nr:alpha/beta hydrolase [Burkholderiales bacterium]
MRASTRREFVAGPAGRIECAVDQPEGTARGIALIAHPHPLFGGTLDNKVVQTLAR